MGQNTFNILSIVAAWIQCIGVIVAAVAVVVAIRQNRRERRLAIYESANFPWVEWLTVCRQHPKLDVFFTPQVESPNLSNEDQRIEKMIFLQFLLAIERLSILQKGEPNTFGDLRSEEWRAFLAPFLERDNFRSAYKIFRPILHNELVNFIDSMGEGTGKKREKRNKD
jgi:hypothetical protein